MTTNGPSSSAFSRRSLLLGSLGGVGVAAGIGLYTTRHHRAHHKQPDGQYRKITLTWPNANMAAVLAVAAQKDFFAKYSLEVENPTDPINGANAIAALANGTAQFAVAPALSWLPHLHNGLEASLILGIQPGTFRLLVRRGAGITRLEQLIGRVVAVPDHNMADKLFLAIMMRRKGLNAMDGIAWRPTPITELMTAAANGSIDAIASHDPVAWQLLNTSSGLFAELVSSNTGHYADRTSLVLGVTNATLTTDPDAATAMVLALRDAAKWTNTHRDDAARLVATATPELSADLIRDMLANEPPIRPVVGHTLRDQMAQYCDELQLIGLLPNTESAAELAHKYTQNVLKG
ncbi:ABC transporter substrate-binding protein [Acetobacter orientalis]|uniref:ABC transporter substrate-binding protein n=1 Tax=Acetobacter orientalis TaxID=146474 RepID=UPI00209EB36A|nr:ABC transporter substrate-binding protein [Acetobacter orientalis]MCP1215856.1 ABC transporter substrate-binding protein [Acetobacter orientalis]MCP1217984.1 ABC transporter substrate-binding protein [Acetobacter orientalis]